MSRLFICLTLKPAWIYYPDEPVTDEPVTVFVDETEFKDTGLGVFTGFYDWLRTTDERIIGVRYRPIEITTHVLNAMKMSPLFEVTSDGYFMIFFDKDQDYDEALSTDQEFEETRLLVSATNRYGILLGCSGLDENGRIVLQKYSEIDERRSHSADAEPRSGKEVG